MYFLTRLYKTDDCIDILKEGYKKPNLCIQKIFMIF
jgi:hypothetical protein